ncbi:hypothetical protein GMORB2_6731 [Geosmithia morbida]|uniref:Uncharacterized protein n=1 Tax=Geosmithia morbida TaxID=1094350 RepID=A0A9P5D458_9HYPO|nr:uncharacterized protein GMORB2_6731 [Geosmithia morbida]KAF4123181.1 hypothetical protein GMORB2_6731 [Geosmithia morbida]
MVGKTDQPNPPSLLGEVSRRKESGLLGICGSLTAQLSEQDRSYHHQRNPSDSPLPQPGAAQPTTDAVDSRP